MKPDHELMACIIAGHSLDDCRRWPSRGFEDLREWSSGRAAAAALIHPCVETLTAANECRFLVNYHWRHGNV
jgi:hypothetical protein